MLCIVGPARLAEGAACPASLCVPAKAALALRLRPWRAALFKFSWRSMRRWPSAAQQGCPASRRPTGSAHSSQLRAAGLAHGDRSAPRAAASPCPPGLTCAGPARPGPARPRQRPSPAGRAGPRRTGLTDIGPGGTGVRVPAASYKHRRRAAALALSCPDGPGPARPPHHPPPQRPPLPAAALPLQTSRRCNSAPHGLQRRARTQLPPELGRAAPPPSPLPRTGPAATQRAARGGRSERPPGAGCTGCGGSRYQRRRAHRSRRSRPPAPGPGAAGLAARPWCFGHGCHYFYRDYCYYYRDYDYYHFFLAVIQGRPTNLNRDLQHLEN
jgi:hypothetical protein